MGKLLVVEPIDCNNILVVNDPWLDTAAADAAYLRLDATNDPLTGALTVANVAGAVNSGAYSLQLSSGVADGASAVGYSLDTSNTLSNAAASLFRIRNNGTTKLSLLPNTAGITTGFGATALLQIGSAALFDDVNITGAGQLGAYYFSLPTAGNPQFGFFPTAGKLIALNTAILCSLAVRGIGGTADIDRVDLDGLQHAFVPGTVANPITLGRNSGNTPNLKWAALYLRDNAAAYFGDNADARMQWDGTDLLLNPDAQVAGGRLRLNSASCWSASAGGSAPALHSNLPTGATGTTRKWLTVKDNAGAIYHIPAWSNA